MADRPKRGETWISRRNPSRVHAVIDRVRGNVVTFTTYGFDLIEYDRPIEMFLRAYRRPRNAEEASRADPDKAERALLDRIHAIDLDWLDTQAAKDAAQIAAIRDAFAEWERKGLREGFEIAEDHAEISTNDGWGDVDPYIYWDVARGVLNKRLAAKEPDHG